MCINWEAISSIATAAAVIVALASNIEAKKQLKSALEMQEQSKNVGLFDRRIEMSECIQAGKSVPKLSLRVLFNDEIVRHYNAWQTYLSEKRTAEHDKNRFFALCREKDREGGYIDLSSIRQTIGEYEEKMSVSGCPHQTVEEYEAFCMKHTVPGKIGEFDEQITYNYSEIADRYNRADREAKQEHKMTLQLIEKFISDSICQVGTNQKSCWFKSRITRRKSNANK
jgi:hypothetical protein